jgi:hypothetical protein
VYFSDTLNNRIRKVVFSDPGVFKNGRRHHHRRDRRAGYGGDSGRPSRRASTIPRTSRSVRRQPVLRRHDNNCVRMIDLTSGVITTVAGTGQNGYSGDGGPATRRRSTAIRRRFRPGRQPLHLRHVQQPRPRRVAVVKITYADARRVAEITRRPPRCSATSASSAYLLLSGKFQNLCITSPNRNAEAHDRDAYRAVSIRGVRAALSSRLRFAVCPATATIPRRDDQ